MKVLQTRPTSSIIAVTIAGVLAIGSLSNALCAAAGQPIISGGTPRTANGQLMRGCCATIGRSPTDSIKAFFTKRSNVIKLRDVAHLNVIRVCVLTPGWGGYSDINQTVPYVDSIVANCEAVGGVYAIINYHGPWVNDGVSSMDIRKFWDFYAPRYKDKSFVIYELCNETLENWPPTGTASDSPTKEHVDIYKNHMRNWAPHNLITGMAEPVNMVGDWGPYLKNVFAPAAGIDWSAGKDAWAMHLYTPDPWTAESPGDIISLRSQGVPVLMTEWSFAAEGWYQQMLAGCAMPSEWGEKNGVSWMVWQQWQNKEPDQLKSVINYLIPDAIAKKYDWWNATQSIEPRTPVAVTAGKSKIEQHAIEYITINGRVIMRTSTNRKRAPSDGLDPGVYLIRAIDSPSRIVVR